MRSDSWMRVPKFRPTPTASFAILAVAVLGVAVPARAATHPESIASTAAASAASTSCPDVNVVFARGTLELPGLGIVGTPFAQSVSSDLPGRTVTDYAVNYAADVLQLSAGPGATDMSDHIISLAAQCPHTQFVIGGYSQGASVTDIAIGINTVLGTGTTIPTPLASRIDAVVVFGNPLGLFGQTIAGDSTLYGPKSDSFCATGDPICGNGVNGLAHISYVTNGDTSLGAQFAAAKVLAANG